MVCGSKKLRRTESVTLYLHVLVDDVNVYVVLQFIATIDADIKVLGLCHRALGEPSYILIYSSYLWRLYFISVQTMTAQVHLVSSVGLSEFVSSKL